MAFFSSCFQLKVERTPTFPVLPPIWEMTKHNDAFYLASHLIARANGHVETYFYFYFYLFYRATCEEANKEFPRQGGVCMRSAHSSGCRCFSVSSIADPFFSLSEEEMSVATIMKGCK